VCKL